jgi:hypothetical protein
MVAKKDPNEKKRIVRKKVVSAEVKNSDEVKSCYCRKCMQIKDSKFFYSATDTYLDQNKKMSVCRDCIADMYSKIFQTEHTIEKTLLRICRMLNMRYSEAAINATLNHLNKVGKDVSDGSIVGIYKTKLMATQRTEVGKRDLSEDFTFVEPLKRILDDPLDEEDEYTQELTEFWGEGLNFNDYAFLEKKLAEWKQSYSCQNKAEEFYLKEICYKELELQKARTEDRSTDPILKSMNDLLSKAALTPQQTNAASSGKAAETWGSFIKTIEETTPAEYFEGPEKELFKDYDNIGRYMWNYITRPIKNFIQNSKDYNILGDDDDFSDEIIEEGEGTNNGDESSTLE